MGDTVVSRWWELAPTKGPEGFQHLVWSPGYLYLEMVGVKKEILKNRNLGELCEGIGKTELVASTGPITF